MARPGSSNLVTLQINGAPIYLGTIAATTTKNNHTTASTFNDSATAASASALVPDGTLAGRVLLVQGDDDAYILTGALNSAAVTSSNGVRVYAGERVILTMPSGHGFLAVLAANTSANLKVWELI